MRGPVMSSLETTCTSLHAVAKRSLLREMHRLARQPKEACNANWPTDAAPRRAGYYGCSVCRERTYSEADPR